MAGPTRSETDAYREQVRVLSEALPAAVSICDPSATVLWVNPYWTRITGLSFEESVGRGWAALSIHPDDVALIDLSFAAGRERFTSWQAEARMRVRSGDWRWFQFRVEPLFGRRGRLEGWISVASDIDAQRSAMDALEMGRARYEALVGAMSTVIFELDAAGDQKSPNPTWSALSGVPFEDTRAGGWARALHPDDVASVVDAWESARAGTRPIIVEFRHWHAPSASYRWMRAHGVPILGADGTAVEWIGTLTDIHDQVRSTLVLKEGEERFRLIAENAPVGLWVADGQGACVYANALLRRFWGIGEDAVGVDWTASAAPDDREAVFEAYREALASQSSFSVEARHRRADGEIRILATEANPRRDPEGAFLGMIGVNIDVTDARRAEHHHRLLINELNHRVKNTLATVQSLAHQTVRSRHDPRQLGALLEGRLMALSAAHNVLNRENWEAAELRAVIGEALRPFEGAGDARLHTRGPRVRVGPQAALAVALAVHELATNAMKYGALSAAAGLVEVEWRLAQGRAAVAFEWRETGGPEVAGPIEPGFGTRLLAGLAFDLGAAADLDFRPEGLVCRLQIPLAEA